MDFFWCTSTGNKICVGAVVRVLEGQHRNKTATVKHISWSQVFLHSPMQTEHAGMFVARSRSCALASSNHHYQNSAKSTAWTKPAIARRQRGKHVDRLMGKSVRIQAGPSKDLLGIVCGLTPTHVQVELFSRPQKIKVVREHVSVVGDKHGITEECEATDAI